MLNSQPILTLVNAGAKVSAVFTAATNNVITSAGHGLSDNDVITMTTTDTLPSPLAFNTFYHVISATTDTFKVSLTSGSTEVDITDTGTGDHTFHKAQIAAGAQIESYKYCVFQLGSADSCDYVIKFAGSISDTCPVWANPRSTTSVWDYVDVIDLEDGASIDGDTGISLSGTDDFRNFQLNTDGLKWVTAICTGATAGSVTLKLKVFEE